MSVSLIQIRNELPELKVVVQYRGKPSQQYHDVYDVRTCLFVYYICEFA